MSQTPFDIDTPGPRRFRRRAAAALLCATSTCSLLAGSTAFAQGDAPRPADGAQPTTPPAAPPPAAPVGVSPSSVAPPPPAAPAEPVAPAEMRREPSEQPSVLEEPRPPAVSPGPSVPSEPPPPEGTPAPPPVVSTGDWPSRLIMKHRDPAYFRRFEELREPSLSVSFPPIIDTVTGDTGGWRSAMADRHMLFELRDLTSFIGGLNSTGQPDVSTAHPQAYSGQKFTISSQLIGLLTWRLDDLHLPNSMIVAGFNLLKVTYDPLGPSTFVIRDLYYYQQWMNKTVEFKIGIMPDYFEYVGFFTGGSTILSSGLSGLVPIAAGISADPYPTPAANVQFNAASGLYAKMGVERSVSPQGAVYETQNQDVGFRFNQTGAGPLLIAEVGVKRPPKPDDHQMWLRAGGLYNYSDYPRFDGQGNKSNTSYWALADYQLFQFDRNRPYRGIYIGGSGFYADPAVNVFTQTYEARIYGIGAIPGRPADAFAIRAQYTRFSENAYRLFEDTRHIPANEDQKVLIGSYTLHAFPGIYIVPNLSIFNHPSFTGNYNNAVVLGVSTSILL